MDFDNPVHNRYVPTFDLEHEYLPSLEGLVLVVGEEEKVSTKEGWLHTATKDVTERGRSGDGGVRERESMEEMRDKEQDGMVRRKRTERDKMRGS